MTRPSLLSSHLCSACPLQLQGQGCGGVPPWTVDSVVRPGAGDFPLGAQLTHFNSQQMRWHIVLPKHSLRDGAGRKGREIECLLPLDSSCQYAFSVFLS